MTNPTETHDQIVERYAAMTEAERGNSRYGLENTLRSMLDGIRQTSIRLDRATEKVEDAEAIRNALAARLDRLVDSANNIRRNLDAINDASEGY